MKLSSKGQITIPAELRRRLNLAEGDEVDVIGEDGALRIVPRFTQGERLIKHSSGILRDAQGPTAGLSTDEIMDLLRGPYEDLATPAQNA